MSDDDCFCHGEGTNDGRYCPCPIGAAMLAAEYQRHAWMAPLARQYNALKRLGEDDAAEALRKLVLS